MGPFGVFCNRHKDLGEKIEGFRIFLKHFFSYWKKSGPKISYWNIEI
jgi:hypothetical protein